MNNDIWNSYWKFTEKDLPDLQQMKYDLYYFLLKFLLNKVKLWKTINKPIKIIEIGCGTGLRTLALLKEYPQYIKEIVFFDQSENALKLVKSYASAFPLDIYKKISFVSGNILSMPFQNGSFDMAWNEGVMEHFSGKRRQEIFNSIYNIIKPEGFYVCLVPNILNIPLIIRNYLLKKNNQWPYGFQREFSIFELKKKLKKSGFRIKSSAGVDSIYLAKEIISLLIKKRFEGITKGNFSKSNTSEKRKILNKFRVFSWKFETRIFITNFIGREIGVFAQKPEKSAI